MYWSFFNFINDSFLSKIYINSINSKYLKFIKILKKNELLFISEEYVKFYELDITTIHGLNNNIHKSKKFVKYINNFLKIAIYNLNYFLIYKSIFKLFNYPYIYYFLYKYNKKLKLKKNFWKLVYTYKVITLNHKTKKLNIIVKNFKKILITLNPGISLKKLGIEEKKNKKSIKIFNIMIKSIFKGIKPSNNLFKCILQFKGTNFYINKYIDYINQLKFKFKDVYFIFTPNIFLYSNKFKFKKSRSLKKNFRKNFLKFK